MSDFDKAEKFVLSRIAELESRIEAEREKLAHLQAAKTILGEMPVEDDGDPVASSNGKSSRPRFVFRNRAGATGLTQAIVKTLEKHASDHFIAPAEVRHWLLEAGFKPSSPNFNNIVGNTLMKLGKRGVIRAERDGYRSMYAARV